MAEPPSKSPGKSSAGKTGTSGLSGLDLSGVTSGLSKAGGPPSYRDAQEALAKAEESLAQRSAPESTPHWDFVPEGHKLDAELQRLVRFAAWVGADEDENLFLTYESLLVGFLLSDDPVSRWFQAYCAEIGADVAGAQAYRSADGEIIEDLHQKVSSEAWPRGSSGSTVTAARMFERAARYVSGGGAQPIGTRHLMAAYVFDTPPERQSRIETWKLDAQRWSVAFRNFVLTHYGLGIAPGGPEGPIGVPPRPGEAENAQQSTPESAPQGTPESTPEPETTWDFLPYGYVLDPKLERVVRLAAWAGAVQDDVFLSYTSLLIGFLLADDDISRWFQDYCREVEADIPALLGSKGCADAAAAEKGAYGMTGPLAETLRAQADAGTWPSGKPDASISARNMVRAAITYLPQGTESVRRQLGPRHLMAAYVFDTPEVHQKQIDEWRLDRAAWPVAFQAYMREDYSIQLAPGQPETPLWEEEQGTSDSAQAADSVEDRPGEFSGTLLADYSFSPGARHLLRAGFALADSLHRQDSRRRTLTANVLIIALVQGLWGRQPDDAGAGQILDDVVRGTANSGHAYDTWTEDYLGGLSLPSQETLEGRTTGRFTADEDLPGLSPFVKRVIDHASAIATDTAADRIGVRHLLAALVLASWEGPDAAKKNRFVRFGLEERAMRKALFYGLRHRVPATEVAAWERILMGEAGYRPTGFSGDRAAGEDRLDVTRYATALASVIASSDVEPPLSVGVFGDWGSGKSFFMNLLKTDIARLAEDDSRRPDGCRQYCEYIASVDFNAWDYAETDLWASLVQSIFIQLEAYITARKEPDEAADLTPLIEQFDLAIASYTEAKQELVEAEAEKTQAEGDLKQAEESLEGEQQTVAALSTLDVAAAVKQTALTALDERAEVVALAGEAEDAFGMKGLKTSVEKGGATLSDALALVEDAGLEARRAGGALDWLLRLPITAGAWLTLGLGALAVLVLGGLLIVWLQTHLPEGATLVGLLSQGVALLGLGVAWARARLRTASRVFDHLDAVRRALDGALAARVREKEAETAGALQQARQAMEEAEEAAAAKRRALAAAEAKVAEAKQSLADSTSARRIAKFIRKRMETGDYEKRLGITATIRKDFERLSCLMAERRAERENPQQAAAVAQRIGEQVQLDRIVLYIDDLDRCPDTQVVKVLEAVHLLLAIPLFVVVVGVDVRWVVRSLHSRFPKHLAEAVYFLTGTLPDERDLDERVDDAEIDAEADTVTENEVEEPHQLGDRATALDYVEKIFQIPFWLPPMTEVGSRNLIASLVAPAVPQPSVPQPSESEPVETPASQTPRDAADPTEGEALAEQVAELPSTQAPDTPDAQDALQPELAPDAVDISPSEPATTEAVSAEATAAPEVTPEDLEILELERAYMLGLAGAVGRSPRRLKRFVNAYRIIKAACSPLDRKTFLVDEGRSGEYRAAMALLAITTGAPGLANMVLSRLWHEEPDTPLDDFLAELAPLIDGEAWREECRCLLAALRHYADAVAAEPGAPKSALTIKDLRGWSPDVARFTFRSGVL